MTPITVVIPVGPLPIHKEYLQEAIASVWKQTLKAGEILLIDDMADLEPQEYPGCRIFRNPWLTGIAGSFNFGVALARYTNVVMLGGDDQLFPTCLEEISNAYERTGGRDGYYWLGCRFSDGREDQFTACHASMVTRGYWVMTGGFPVESASGAPDAALISERLIHGDCDHEFVIVNRQRPLYWVRIHEEQDTNHRYHWQGVILSTRKLLTDNWKPPQWGRFSL